MIVDYCFELETGDYVFVEMADGERVKNVKQKDLSAYTQLKKLKSLGMTPFRNKGEEVMKFITLIFLTVFFIIWLVAVFKVSKIAALVGFIMFAITYIILLFDL